MKRLILLFLPALLSAQYTPPSSGGGGGGGATIPSVTNLIKGNGAGNGADTKVSITAPATAWTIVPAADNQTTTVPGGTLLANGGALGTPSSGSASNLTATTQSQADASTKLATTAYVDTGLAGKSGLIGSGTATLGTGALNANTCASAVTVGATGVLTTDVVTFTPNANISAVTGYGALSTDGLKVYPWPSANNVNFTVCNGTGSSITPGAVTLNWLVAR